MNITAAQAPASSVITHYIAGRPVTSSRPPFANVDPATGQVVGHVHEADAGIAIKVLLETLLALAERTQ